MWSNYPLWRLRFVIIAILTLVVVAVSIDMHPRSTEALTDAVSILTHSHDVTSEDSAEHSHRGVHHDHHAEMAFDTSVDFLLSLDHHDRYADQRISRQLYLAFDRPPQSAQC